LAKPQRDLEDAAVREAAPGPGLLLLRQTCSDVSAEGGMATGQRQNGPGAERLEGLANGRVCRKTALNARTRDTQRLATDVVELTLLDESIDTRAGDAEAPRGFDGRKYRDGAA
jgi:hypothetical protein